MERLLSVREAREILGISTAMFYKLIGQGELPVVKLGERTLFRPSDLDELVDRNVRKPKGRASKPRRREPENRERDRRKASGSLSNRSGGLAR
jgi:excisionase family DNA binding protein